MSYREGWITAFVVSECSACHVEADLCCRVGRLSAERDCAQGDAERRGRDPRDVQALLDRASRTRGLALRRRQCLINLEAGVGDVVQSVLWVPLEAAPQQFPDGIDIVVVNGTIVVDNGRHTGSRTGRVLRT